LVFPLVGPWSFIPLADSAARAKAVRRLVDQQFAGVDARPALRRSLFSQISRQGSKAAEGGASPLAPLVAAPVGASLVVARAPRQFEDVAAASALGAELAAGRAGLSVDVAARRYGPVLRLSGPRRGKPIGGARPHQSLVAEHGASPAPTLSRLWTALDGFGAAANALRDIFTQLDQQLAASLEAEGEG
jgi:hypothetical protein